jgi:nucleoside-diphosphate-sugar epimerase
MILVTGGTGLVGSHLLYHLSKNNEPIKAIYRRKEKLDLVKNVFSYYSKNFDELFGKIEWCETDLNDIPNLTQVFTNVTQVYHCAALVTFDPNRYHELRKSNIQGTANIVNLCISHQVNKICFVSSIAAIGDTGSQIPATEETPWNAEADNNIYAITKYGAELEIWRGTQEGTEAIIVNPGIIIGPGFWRSSSGSLIKRIHKGLKYYTKGVSGYVDIHDVVTIMIQAMNSSIKNERFILVSDHLSFKEFAEKVAEKLEVIPPKKEASKFLLQIGWRLDWLNYFFKRKYRKLTRHNVRSITSDSFYSSEKVKNTLGYTFKNIDTSIDEACQLFLKDIR